MVTDPGARSLPPKLPAGVHRKASRNLRVVTGIAKPSPRNSSETANHWNDLLQVAKKSTAPQSPEQPRSQGRAQHLGPGVCQDSFTTSLGLTAGLGRGDRTATARAGRAARPPHCRAAVGGGHLGVTTVALGTEAARPAWLGWRGEA